MNEADARQAIADHLGVSVARICDAAEFRDLGADSLDLIELSVALEQLFDIRIPDEEVEHCTTVGEALEILRRAPRLRSAMQTGTDG